MTDLPPLLDFLPLVQRRRLLSVALDVSFPVGARLFDEDGEADRFWLLRRGEVALDVRLSGRQPEAVVETLGPGQLLGWSWVCPPYRWHLGARAVTGVEALEFPATDVLALCAADPELGYALMRQFTGVVAERLQATRIRLLDLYAPQGSGPR
ncbi:Crp/Fnr family transcriptional regulator [Streptomyces sp. NBC_01571]|uniref:Crp/Fnr family transcriptional regulator n=1 Tax=Streptomyces sp. NBC_01571 TaxID=2975883 RepID=UPI00225B9BB6|nr:Crp/Fnr family transcriptional regulator [Streptomyces sp. NBC_01571]MCX4572682.1 Crp/Fnr family transcriptional regulator [Streptomyces sp. NBC_01571]